MSKKSKIWLLEYFQVRINILFLLCISIGLALTQYENIWKIFVMLIQLRIWDDWVDRAIDKKLYQRDIMCSPQSFISTLIIVSIVYLILSLKLIGIQWIAYNILLILINIWYLLRPDLMKFPFARLVLQFKYPLISFLFMLPIDHFSFLQLIALICISTIAVIYEYKDVAKFKPLL